MCRRVQVVRNREERGVLPGTVAIDNALTASTGRAVSTANGCPQGTVMNASKLKMMGCPGKPEGVHCTRPLKVLSRMTLF
jgi:hypothetical protein